MSCYNHLPSIIFFVETSFIWVDCFFRIKFKQSGLLVKKYKEEYIKKHNNKNYYKGNKETSNLKRWFNEKWTNQRGEVGYKKKGDIYRPTIRINEKTPITFNELTKNQIERAKKEKATKGRVKKFS